MRDTPPGPASGDALGAGAGDDRLPREQAREVPGPIERVLRVVAHDLRNPLAVIQGYAELSRRQLAAGAPSDRVAERLDKIAGNARRMARQLADFVDGAVLRENRPLDLQLREADLRDPLRALADEFRACYTGLQLEGSFPDEPLTGSYDVARIQSVFANLLDNAMKYGEPNLPITLEARRRGDVAEVIVVDHGIGIAEDDRARLLDAPTHAADPAGRPAVGLGLPGAASIVRQHGGEIEIESTPGEGTTVTVRLPLASRR